MKSCIEIEFGGYSTLSCTSAATDNERNQQTSDPPKLTSSDRASLWDNQDGV